MKLVDMRLTDSEKAEQNGPMSVGAVNEYPWGLCIRLSDKELEKLSVDHADWTVGDIFDLRAMARVTSISSNETTEGERTGIELQLVMLGAEVEDSEEEEPKSRVKQEKKKSRLYKD